METPDLPLDLWVAMRCSSKANKPHGTGSLLASCSCFTSAETESPLPIVVTLVLQDPAIAALKAQLAAMQAGRRGAQPTQHAVDQVCSPAELDICERQT